MYFKIFDNIYIQPLVVVLSAFLLCSCQFISGSNSVTYKEKELIKMEENIEDKKETRSTDGRVCIQIVWNERSKSYDIIPCR